jgi:hypothetical protein
MDASIAGAEKSIAYRKQKPVETRETMKALKQAKTFYQLASDNAVRWLAMAEVCMSE